MKTVSSERPETDALLRVVADEQRRAVLRALASTEDGVLDYETLIERVLDRIRADGTTLPRSEHRDRVRISLYHTHLPKLADCGLVINDSDEKSVRRIDDDRTGALLDCVESLR